MSEGTVLVTSRSFGSGSRDLVGELSAAGLTVVRGPSSHDLPAVRDQLASAAAWIAGTGPVTEAHLAAAPRLRVLARYGVGVDAVDLAAARARGLVVTNTPGANTDAVADHAVALLLAVLRAVVPGDRDVRAGEWAARRGRELGALTVGVVGFGRIGTGVARRLSGFGCRLLAHDPNLSGAQVRDRGAEPATLRELAERCQAVSLHSPGGRRLVDAAWLRSAHPGAVLVNTARADLVDEHAVAAALRSGQLAGYAADTLACETGDPHAAGPLVAPDLADRVVVTPHVGAQTLEAVDRMGATATADVLAVLSGASPAHPVPLPEDT